MLRVLSLLIANKPSKPIGKVDRILANTGSPPLDKVIKTYIIIPAITEFIIGLLRTVMIFIYITLILLNAIFNKIFYYYNEQ